MKYTRNLLWLAFFLITLYAQYRYVQSLNKEAVKYEQRRGSVTRKTG
jgi:hypothetical protein